MISTLGFRKRILIGATLIFGGFLISAIARSNDPTTAASAGRTLPKEFAAPAPVRAIIQRACLDCHSDQTVWPWYSQIPPISRQIQADVASGRESMDFSSWSDYSPEERRAFAIEIAQTAASGTMPPARYVWLHHEAKLSDSDRELLTEWARAQQEK